MPDCVWGERGREEGSQEGKWGEEEVGTAGVTANPGLSLTPQGVLKDPLYHRAGMGVGGGGAGDLCTHGLSHGVALPGWWLQCEVPGEWL